MKRIIIILMALSLAAAPAFAEEGFGGFWKSLKSKVQGITPKKTTVTTAVGGVRGAKDESAVNLYWKGRDASPILPAEEVESFNQALNTAIEGNPSGSVEQFNAFLKKYPDSELRQDAVRAIMELDPNAKVSLWMPPIVSKADLAPAESAAPAEAPAAESAAPAEAPAAETK